MGLNPIRGNMFFFQNVYVFTLWVSSHIHKLYIIIYYIYSVVLKKKSQVIFKHKTENVNQWFEKKKTS